MALFSTALNISTSPIQMGDVLAITDTEGSIVGNYEYDAWGKVLTADTDIAKQNPIRYRGYYYDNETGYYYLQSRYYDSKICRFINADDYKRLRFDKESLLGIFLYTYCENNPTLVSDNTGFGKKLIVFIAYANPKTALTMQAIQMKKREESRHNNTLIFKCYYASDFIAIWNSLFKYQIFDLHLYIHGKKSKLCFLNSYIVERPNISPDYKKNKSYKTRDRYFSELKKLKINGMVYLNSCEGGTTGNTQSVATSLAKKMCGSRVRAVVNGNVYYRGIFHPYVDGTPLTKEKGAYWADFYCHRGKVCVTNKRRNWYDK